MTRLRLFAARLRGLAFRRRVESEMEEELRFRLRLRAEENARRGGGSATSRASGRRAAT